MKIIENGTERVVNYDGTKSVRDILAILGKKNDAVHDGKFLLHAKDVLGYNPPAVIYLEKFKSKNFYEVFIVDAHGDILGKFMTLEGATFTDVLVRHCLKNGTFPSDYFVRSGFIVSVNDTIGETFGNIRRVELMLCKRNERWFYVRLPITFYNGITIEVGVLNGESYQSILRKCAVEFGLPLESIFLSSGIFYVDPNDHFDKDLISKLKLHVANGPRFAIIECEKRYKIIANNDLPLMIELLTNIAVRNQRYYVEGRYTASLAEHVSETIPITVLSRRYLKERTREKLAYVIRRNYHVATLTITITMHYLDISNIIRALFGRIFFLYVGGYMVGFDDLIGLYPSDPVWIYIY